VESAFPDLVGSVPAAAAVIVVVAMFLRFLREERKARDDLVRHTNEVLDGMRDTIRELSLEIREQTALLRDQLKVRPSAGR